MTKESEHNKENGKGSDSQASDANATSTKSESKVNNKHESARVPVSKNIPDTSEKQDAVTMGDANSTSNTARKAAKTPTKSTGANPAMSESPKSTSGSSKALLVLLLLLNIGFVGATGYGAYWGWQQWQQYQSDNAQQVAALESGAKAELAALKQRVQRQEQQQKQTLKAQNGQLQSALQDQYDRLISLENQMQQVAGLKNGHWYISEADYLIRMAGRKIWLEKDSATAINLLIEADQRLSLHHEPALIPVRQALATDIEALKTLDVRSEMDVALTLQALYGKVTALTMPEPKVVFGSVQSLPAEPTFWDKFGHWVSENLFRISYTERHIAPYMTEQERWLIKEQLKFHILAAQSALLQQRVALYQEALRDAQVLLKHYYDTQAAAVISFDTSLTELANTDFGGQYPARLSVTDALAQYTTQASAIPSMPVSGDSSTIQNAPANTAPEPSSPSDEQPEPVNKDIDTNTAQESTL